MKAGELNIRITFMQARIGKDTYNEAAETWEDAFTVWASMITSGGKEFYLAQKVNEETTAVFKIRYRSGISTRQRIRYGTRIFEILPGADDVNGKHCDLLIPVKEVV